MTAIVWDQVGERRYETGIDRGVLYPSGGIGVPWNGLVSVSETRAGTIKSYFIDGMKYLDKHIPGSYAAKLSAFTYPDVLDSLIGSPEFAPGVHVHDQPAKLFHLSYRTRIANDIDGVDHGYKLHIIYHVLANPSDFSADTIGANAEAKPFDFDLTGTPQNMFGIRPTSHISLDSRRIDPEILETLEKLIYGTEPTPPENPGDDPIPNDPQLPSLFDLLAMVNPDPVIVT